MSDDSRDFDKEKQDFMVLMVETIQEWGEIEHMLFDLFVEAMEPAPIEACSAAFGSALNFNIKIKMTYEALKIKIKDPDLAACWNRLYPKLRKAGERRNKIAHYTFSFGFFNEHSCHALIEPGYAVLKDLKNGAIERDIINLKRLKDFKQSFKLRQAQIQEFRKEYYKLKKPRASL